MKRLLFVSILTLGAAFGAEEGEHKGGLGEPSLLFKWINFALLAGGLVYLLKGHAGTFFAERTAKIQSGLVEAKKLREDSEARATEIERRVANLEADMDALRQSSKKEMAAEAERIRTETAHTITKIHNAGEQQIASAVKLARQELKVYSADLAIQLAAAQIRERLDGAAQQQLVDGFVSELGRVQKVQ